jgi:polar amino acid transport system substrate-binding protein
MPPSDKDGQMRDRRLRLAGVFAALTLWCCALTLGSAAATLHVGSDVSGAPFEFYQPNSKIPVGFDLELLAAMMAKSGDRAVVVNHQFNDLLQAVRRGTFDAAMSAISDTSAREKLVDFLDYFVAGGGIVVAAGNPLHVFGIDGLCGYSVTVEIGTSYQGDLQKQSADCQSVGLGPIRILTYNTDDEAFAAFVAGKAPVYIADYPVGVYRARYADGGKPIEVVGRQFDVVPYGIAVAKTNRSLLLKLQRALMAVIADGTYDKLLKKWGLTQGALRVAPIDAGKLF